MPWFHTVAHGTFGKRTIAVEANESRAFKFQNMYRRLHAMLIDTLQIGLVKTNY